MIVALPGLYSYLFLVCFGVFAVVWGGLGVIRWPNHTATGTNNTKQQHNNNNK